MMNWENEWSIEQPNGDSIEHCQAREMRRWIEGKGIRTMHSGGELNKIEASFTWDTPEMFMRMVHATEQRCNTTLYGRN